MARTKNVPRRADRVAYKDTPAPRYVKSMAILNLLRDKINKRSEKRNNNRKTNRNLRGLMTTVKTKYYDGITVKKGYRTPKIFGYVLREIDRKYKSNERNDAIGRSGKYIKRPILTELVSKKRK